VNNNSLKVDTLTRVDARKGLVAFLFISLFVFLALYQLRPIDVIPASAPLTEFSSERAMKHLEAIGYKPHPPGSPELANVRDYILSEFTALGFEPQIQSTTAVRGFSDLPFPSAWAVEANVENILVRLDGTDNSKAVMVAGHYDSVVTSPNASDGGSSVAVALELARVLQTDQPLKNDVIFLLTNVEENFLMGGRAFVDYHPWVNDVGVVLHFIARGTSGPSIMFETSSENGWLVKEFAKAVPHPIANSLAYEVYQLLPNDTDFSTYREAGLAGLNFAYIDDSAYYHTMLDTPDNLDKRSLQHHGSSALALTRHFGNLNLENVKDENVVFFDILGLTVIHYPESWILPLTLLVVLVYFGVIAFGLKRKQLTLLGIGAGALTLILTVLGAYIITSLFQSIILATHSEYTMMFLGNLYNSKFYLISFVSLTVAIAALFYVGFRKRVRVQNLIAGALFVWLILMVASSFILAGASYLFTWSLLFSILALGFTIVSPSQALDSWQNLVAFSLGAIPSLVLLIPIIYLVYIALPALTMGGLAVSVLTVLLLGSLVPHLTILTRSRAWVLPLAAVTVCVGFTIAGSLTASFTSERPKQASIYYGLHVDTEEAFWISDYEPDEWTVQFFPNGSSQEYDPFNFFDPFGSDLFLGPAPIVSAPLPTVELVDESVSNGVRQLHLNIAAPVPARMIGVRVNIEPDTVLSARSGNLDFDMDIRPDDEWVAVDKYPYSPGTDQDIELYLETMSTQPIKAIALVILDDMPDLPFSPRPSNMIPSSNGPLSQDSTIVQKSFEFPLVYE
jgi:hypothetical protein